MNAEICLYGTHRYGTGWLAVTEDGRMFGDGELVKEQTFTDAVWLACDKLRQAGVKGTVRVFASGGERYADFNISYPPYFGDLQWNRAPMYTVAGVSHV